MIAGYARLVRVHVVDPSAYTPPYDHALCTALARAGVETELVTSRFTHGDVPEPDGYVRTERFYRRQPPGRLRLPAKLVQHVPGMLSERRAARWADLVHFQWLAVQHLDAHLLPRKPRVLTAHDVLPREPRPGQRRAQRRLYRRMDAIVVHTAHGRERLVSELGVDPARVHVIPHGAFVHLTRLEGELPRELPEPGERPVALFFGLLRPYKGIDVLLEAWRGIDGCELWIVGAPRMPIEHLRAAAPPGVRWLPRFVSDTETAALFRRADVVVLPYREAEASGVLATALAFEKPVVASAVGGLEEIEGARLVAPGDPAALRAALRFALESRPAPTDPSPYGWDEIGRMHADLYARLVG
jgi:glycosyltransferase involved in cell wall biosynthesis